MPSPAIDPAAILVGLRKAVVGPRPLQDKKGKTPVAGLFPTGTAGKQLADSAVAAGWLAERIETRPTGPAGRSKKVSVGWELTPTGRQHLADADNPRPVLEAILPVLRRIADRPAATPTPAGDFQQSVAAAITTCVAAVETAFQQLQRSIADQLTRLETAVADAPAKLRPVVEAAVGRLGADLATVDPTALPPTRDELAAALPLLTAVLGRLSATPQTPTPAALPPAPPEPPPTAATTTSSEPTAGQVVDALKAAYDELRLSVVSRDGLVPIPRLYHEATRRLPRLSPDQFRRELTALRDARQVELHVLNEVQSAREPELAVRENDRLLYFVMWK